MSRVLIQFIVKVESIFKTNFYHFLSLTARSRGIELVFRTRPIRFQKKSDVARAFVAHGGNIKGPGYEVVSTTITVICNCFISLFSTIHMNSSLSDTK